MNSTTTLTYSLILIDDDPQMQKDIKEVIDNFNKDQLTIIVISSPQDLNCWLDRTLKNKPKEGIIVLTDFDYGEWRDEIKDFFGEPINAGDAVLSLLHLKLENIGKILYSKQTKSHSFNKMVKEGLAEGTIPLSKDFERTDELKEAIELLIAKNKKASLRVSKDPEKETKTPVQMQVIMAKQAKTVISQAVLVALVKKINKQRFDPNKVVQIGPFAGRFVDPKTNGESGKKIPYTIEHSIELTYCIDLEDKDEKEKPYLTKRIKLNDVNLEIWLSPKKITPVQEVIDAWNNEKLSDFGKAIIAALYPQSIMGFLDQKGIKSIDYIKQTCFKSMKNFDIFFKLEIFYHIFKILIDEGIKGEKLQDLLEQWNKVLGKRLYDILELDVLTSDTENGSTTCWGSSLEDLSDNRYRDIPTNILTKLGCDMEHSSFRYFVTENESGLPDFHIQPIR